MKETTKTFKSSDCAKHTKARTRPYTAMGQSKTIQEWYDICQLPAGDYETGFERFAVRLSRGEFLWDAMTRKNTNEEAVKTLEAMKAGFKKNRKANAGTTKRRASGGPTVMECTVNIKSGQFIF